MTQLSLDMHNWRTGDTLRQEEKLGSHLSKEEVEKLKTFQWKGNYQEGPGWGRQVWEGAFPERQEGARSS